MALGCNSDSYIAGGQHVSALEDYARLGTAPGFCHHCHTRKCPVGVTTQDSALELRLDPAVGAKRLKNYMFAMMTMMSTSGLMVISQMASFSKDFGITGATIFGMGALPLALTMDRFTNGLTRRFSAGCRTGSVVNPPCASLSDSKPWR